jgi:hypothetical protein
MVDFLALDLIKFEEQMLHFIEIYYNYLKNKEEEPLSPLRKNGDLKWKAQIINLLDNKIGKDCREGFKSRKEAVKKYLDEATKKNKLNYEFYMIMDIAELLYEIYFDAKNKNLNENYNRRIKIKSSEHIKKHMSRNICKEIAHLRNELSHDENPPLEYILRFYEDQYYIIKFMKPSEETVKLNDYVTKEIKINIHIYLEKNLNYIKSFELDPIQEEFIKFENSNNIANDVYKNYNFSINNKTRDAIKSMFEFTPFKLPNHTFNLKNEEKSIIKDDKKHENIDDKSDSEEEDNNIYDRSLGHSSRNTISDLQGSFSSSSERASINESTSKPGNPKEGDESISNLSRTKYLGDNI